MKNFASRVAMFSFLIAAFGGSAEALSTDPQPVSPGWLAGTWICYSGDGSARLDFREDKTGFLVVHSIHGDESFKLVQDGDFDRVKGRFYFKAQPVKARPNIEIWGYSTTTAFVIELEGPAGVGDKFSLERDARAKGEMDRFDQAIALMRASP